VDLISANDQPVVPVPLILPSREGGHAQTVPAFSSALLCPVEVNSLDNLAPYREDWNRLLKVTPGATYFHSYDWLASYWRHHGHSEDQRLRTILVLHGDKIVGIVPLVVRREVTKVGLLRALTYPLHGWGSFYGPIGAHPQQLLNCAMDRIRHSPRNWDLLDLRWVDQATETADHSHRALHSAGFPARRAPWLESAVIELHDGWNLYWADRKAHWRTNVRRGERRLREKGKLEFVRYRPEPNADPRWDLYDICEQLAAKSWQGSSRTGTTLSHDSVRAYLRDAHAAAAGFGSLDMNLLYINGQPSAFAYNYQYQGHVYGLRVGFDASLSMEGAGTVLQKMMIEDSCRRGDYMIDLGPGSLHCKRHWRTRIAVAERMTHYSLTSPRAQALRLLHAVKMRSNHGSQL